MRIAILIACFVATKLVNRWANPNTHPERLPSRIALHGFLLGITVSVFANTAWILIGE